ncbi:dolichol kinase EVAN isoform X2 [Abrus precatorius]|uniref:dolichol kinase n=1 Tax=Abrus precatorius TaxID=3816 RepID=A0A8B8KCZ8_ABRPR|nr:dolichol kinase EVAN isoform X2 [Abrus precatorius]
MVSLFPRKTELWCRCCSMTTSFLNGERAVVLLFISTILFSLPLSLLFHGVSLSLLTLASFFLEISFDNSNSPSLFRTRPGASSGILLGAVTLPSLLLSKLVQLSRGLSLAQLQLQEIQYLTLQYWATSASACSVVLFLAFAQRRSPLTPSHWVVRFSLCSIFFQALVSVAALATTSQIGEAFLVTAGIVLYFGDMLLLTIKKLCGLLVSTKLVTAEHELRRSEISIIIQGLVLGLLLYPVALKYILQIWEWSINTASAEGRRYTEVGRSIIFIASLGFVLIVIVPSWMQFVQEFHVHPFFWVLSFVFSEPSKRLSLCIYWVCIICVSVLRFYNISKKSKIERILLRKYYHLMAVSMFLPALIFQPKFLDLAFGAALAVFLTLEIIRVWRIWPLGQPINQFMNAFTDHRDSDLLIVSHFSLLLGCALPIWMSSGYNDRPLAPFAGILSLGIGDTMASMVGHKYGVLRWSKTGKKTVEGTAAGITSVLAACSLLLPLLASTGYILTQHWFSLLLAVTVSGLLEAYTAQLDNAFIPLFFYSLLCL